MRRFVGGYDIVQVWSVTKDEHQDALEIYRCKGYEQTEVPTHQLPGAAVPYRSEVRRRLRDTRDDAR